jgi:hypothetical protein
MHVHASYVYASFLCLACRRCPRRGRLGTHQKCVEQPNAARWVRRVRLHASFVRRLRCRALGVDSTQCRVAPLVALPYRRAGRRARLLAPAGLVEALRQHEHLGVARVDELPHACDAQVKLRRLRVDRRHRRLRALRGRAAARRAGSERKTRRRRRNGGSCPLRTPTTRPPLSPAPERDPAAPIVGGGCGGCDMGGVHAPIARRQAGAGSMCGAGGATKNWLPRSEDRGL